MANNGNFFGLLAGVTEKALSRKWNHVYTSAYPLLTLLYDGGKGTNYNRGFRAEGNKILLPVVIEGPSTAVTGRTAATYTGGSEAFNQQDDAFTPTLGVGPAWAEYEITQYHGAFWTTAEERQLAISASSDVKRANLMDAKTDQLMHDFKRHISVDLASATVETRAKVLGIRYVTSASNTVGGIAQGSYAGWQGIADASVGAISVDILDRNIHAVRAEGRAETDLLLLSYASGNDLYGKVKSIVGASALVTNPGDTMKYGFKNFMYDGIACVLDECLGTASSGTIYGAASSTWYLYDQGAKPQQEETIRLPGSAVNEHYYLWTVGIGCNDPSCNFLISGAS